MSICVQEFPTNLVHSVIGSKQCIWLNIYTNKKFSVLILLAYSFRWYFPLGVHTFQSFPHSWLITGLIIIVTRRMPIVEPELHTLPEHPVSSGVCVPRSLVLCVMFCRSLFVLLSFFFGSLCCLPFFDLRILINPFGILDLRILINPFGIGYIHVVCLQFSCTFICQ